MTYRSHVSAMELATDVCVMVGFIFDGYLAAASAIPILKDKSIVEMCILVEQLLILPELE